MNAKLRSTSFLWIVVMLVRVGIGKGGQGREGRRFGLHVGMAQASCCSSAQALNRLIDRRGSAVPYSAVHPRISNSGKASSFALPTTAK